MAFLKPLHHLFPMHIKQRRKGSSQLPVGCARLIIKPQTSALAGEIKTALVTLRPANGTVRSEQFIFACEFCARVALQQVTFQYSHPHRKVHLNKGQQIFKKMPEGCYEISSMVSQISDGSAQNLVALNTWCP